ncbi:MAG: SdiA-regulated domain-containing protein [Desulfobacteraceae bacterium]|jgi:uncharacterized protein YjiK
MNINQKKVTITKSGLITLIASLFLLTLIPMSAIAGTAGFDLSNYTLTGTYFLPRIPASEASAVTYNADTDSLFVLGDEGYYLVEVSKTGEQLGVMALTGFDDTEGLTYLGSNQFVLTEERLREAYLLEYSAGGSVVQSSLPSADLGTTIGNTGIEGISYDPRDGSFVTVKEKSPQEVNINEIDFNTGNAIIDSLFTPNLGVSDLSDVQVLSVVSSLMGTEEADNLLIYSQESARLLEVDRTGNILSQFDFSGISSSGEGVTIDNDGNIYIVAENGATPMLYTLQPVPIPGAVLLLGSGLAGLIGLKRCRASIH